MDNQYPPVKKNLPILKIIIVVFAAVIAFELLMGAKTLLTPISVKKPQTVILTEGSISLAATKQAAALGESIPINIKIATGGHLTAGVDLVLKYDPSVLEASPASFIKGNTFDDYPPMDINSTKGVIRISGVMAANKAGFKGSGDFGTLQFITKARGSTNISLDFKQSQTSDSNMVEVGTNNDVLGSVGSVTINIQ